ncbi:uncharacterized protein LOC108149103 [Drosophila elegans]|uniref:uncharacterized protein LOC108149103 n=1 Tax=Drosophila elegans TaxID=30023 RepID=UPI0007E813CE|nr:uncharacterized protein LOC108149103 [Drosophila elegans]
METETNTELQLEDVIDETIVEEASIHENVSTQSTPSSEDMVKSAEKEEKLLMLREVKRRLREREKEEEKILEVQSISEKEEEEEHLLWSKLEDDVESKVRRTTRFSDVAAFTKTLETAQDEGEDSPAPFESSSESEPEVPETGRKDSIDPMKLAVKTLMLVPSLSDISLPTEPEPDTKSIRSQSVKSQRLTIADNDYDSVEGESGESHSDSQTSMGNQISSRSLRESSSDEILEEVPFSDHTIIDSQKDMDFESYFANQREKSAVSEADVSAELRAKETQQVVLDFLNDMIKSVVVEERKDTDEYIRKSLDKEKLLVFLQRDVNDHIVVNDSHRLLQERVIDYYRRSKNQRPFADLPLNEEMAYASRYDQALAYLSYAQERLDKVKEKYSILMTKASLDLDHAMHIVSGTEAHLEQTVRRLLIRPDAESDFLKRLVARELRLMAELRNRISDTRLLVISQKHTMGLITKKIKELEMVCEGVSMQDFIMVQTKTLGLEKKIDDRNLDLNKQRSHYYTELHLIKHNREKTLALKNRIVQLKIKLMEKNIIKNDVKTKLYRAKLERKKIKGRINELTYQGGILAMPALMYDYDRTVAYIREKQERVASLKQTLRSLNSHLRTVLPGTTKSLFHLDS